MGTGTTIGCSDIATPSLLQELPLNYGTQIFPVAVAIKYSKQGIRDILEVQTDLSNDSMAVRSMPI